MPKKKKHPMEMTDEEALNHIFHPEIAKARIYFLYPEQLSGNSSLLPS